MESREALEASRQAIQSTIRRYQTTFSQGDRDGWLALFHPDAVVEDPVGTNRFQGLAELGKFWDSIHSSGANSYVVPSGSPAICGLEAAWAFEVHVEGDRSVMVISIIDVGRFDRDGRILLNRAFWDSSTVRMIDKQGSNAGA